MTTENQKDEKIKYLEGEVQRQRTKIRELINDRAHLELELVRTQNDLLRANERINWLTKYSENEHERATEASRELYLERRIRFGEYLARQEADPLDKEILDVLNFLAGVGLTPQRLASMYPRRQEETVILLRRYVAKAHGGPDSWYPSTDMYNAILKFLSLYDPRAGRNQLLPSNPKKVR